MCLYMCLCIPTITCNCDYFIHLAYFHFIIYLTHILTYYLLLITYLNIYIYIGWKYITSESGAQVYRKFFKSGPSREYACVMCNGTINSPPHKVLALLSDTSRVKEYNSLYENGKEVAEVADNTKILWVTTPPIFPLKPRDFCMVWHVRKLKDGTCIVLNRAVDHPLAPVTRNFVRAEVVLGASIIQPIPGDSRRSRLTMITQLNPGGFAPPTLINFLCTMGPIGYMKNVEVASKRSGARV